MRANLLAATALTLFAFAGNSLLGRMALGPGGIDPASYTAIRLAAGALVLALLVGRRELAQGSWRSALALFVYAAGFSFAYVGLDTGIGALILFAAVQISMIGAALYAGARMPLRGWLGSLMAIAGLVVLLHPGLRAPPPLPASLMFAAGVGWGVYSLRGRGAGNPLAATAGNFVRALLPALALLAAMLPRLQPHGLGVLWAIISGALTSGLGYALWYRVLPQLGALRAASVQLSVPVLATLLGVVVLNEPLHLRFVIAATLVLAGIALTLRRSPG